MTAVLRHPKHPTAEVDAEVCTHCIHCSAMHTALINAVHKNRNRYTAAKRQKQHVEVAVTAGTRLQAPTH